MIIMHLILAITYGVVAYMMSLSKTGDVPYWRSVHLPQTDSDERVRRDVNLASIPLWILLTAASIIIMIISFAVPTLLSESAYFVHIIYVIASTIVMMIYLLVIANKYEKKWKEHDRQKALGYDDRPVVPE
jgi:L-asparagine transporter-like permease